MKHLLLIFLFLVSCENRLCKKAIVSLQQETFTKKGDLPGSVESIHEETGRTDTLDRTKPLLVFVDSIYIGRPKQNKVELHYYPDEDKVMIQLFNRHKNRWILHQETACYQSPVAGGNPEVADFNNDGLNDLTVNNEIAARGANEIRQLFIFKNGKLNAIRNSMLFPNLRYNKQLDCLDAWMVYGGSSSVFLKIEKDSLKEFARVSLSDDIREIYTVDAKGNRKILSSTMVKNQAVYTRYSNYNPLVEDRE